MTTAAPAIPAAAAALPVLRPAVAVVVSRFPLITETFILREIEELERQGQPVRLVPLMLEAEPVVHPEARSWVERALATGWLSPAILAALGRRLRADGRATLRLAGRVAAASWHRPGVLARNLALVPKAVYLAERLAGEGITHLHAHFATYPATLAYLVWRLAGIPYSVTAHAHDIFVHHDELLLEKLAAARWVRTISRFNRDWLDQCLPGLPPGRLRVIHVGVAGARQEASRPAPAEPPILLAVAALKPYKGLPVLLEACRLLRRRGLAFRCEIVGDGPERRSLARRIRRLGLDDTVELLGARTQGEVAERLARATVVVAPSVVARDGQMDGIPVALMEAMAAGRPVVASALSGIPELVEDGITGRLVPPNDSAALAAVLEDLLRSPERRRATLAAASRRVREEFDLAATTRELALALQAEIAPPHPKVIVAAAALVPDLGASELAVRALWRRRDSVVARLGRAGEPAERDLVLKVHRAFAGESRGPAARARGEWECLGRLQDLLGAEAVPRPLAVAPQAGALLMTAAPGRPLDEVLREGRFAGRREWERALRSLGAAGAWLARFHDAWPVTSSPDTVWAAFAGEVARLVEDPTIPAAERPRLQARWARLAGAPGRPRLGARHGDFWPGNLFVDDERCAAIDFEGLQEGLAGEDVATFLLHLEALLPGPLFAGRRGRARRAFLAGYGAAARLDAETLRLCRFAAALRIHRHLPSGTAERRRRRLLAAARAA